MSVNSTVISRNIRKILNTSTKLSKFTFEHTETVYNFLLLMLLFVHVENTVTNNKRLFRRD